MTPASAIIVAAGKGTRMGPNIDKLFLELAGRPVIAHTWAVFDSCPEVREIILVVRAGMENEFKRIAEEYGLRKTAQFIPGGAERQNSVWNGLQAVSPDSPIVAIHDGARPCVTRRMIADCINAAAKVGAAVAAQKVTDTLKEAGEDHRIARTVDRAKLWAVQTPQVFKTGVIRRALGEVFNRGLVLTDDTAACEWIGQPVQLVGSSTPNPKITTPADLPLLEALLRSAPRETSP